MKDDMVSRIENTTDCYKQYFNDSCSRLEKAVFKKLKIHNNTKSSLVNPHFKTISITVTHRVTFASVLGKNFLDDELFERSTSFKQTHKLCVTTLQRLVEILPSEAIFKHHSSGDVTINTPWCKFSENHEMSNGGDMAFF